MSNEPQTPVVVEAEPAAAVEPDVAAIRGKRISALSLSSIRAKRELEATLQKKVVNLDDLPTEPFTPEEFMAEWNAYAEKLSKSGLMLMYSLMGMVKPEIDGHIVRFELPNEGSKLSFDENKYDLVNFIRKKLSNYDIEIHITVNEEITIKKIFDPRDKLKYMHELNPKLELLFRTFDLELRS